MRVNVAAAERFVLANARLLERHRLACLLHGASTEPVVAALRAYRNPDRGFGHALEPDIRAPTSEPSATLHAFEVLAEVGRLDEPMLADAADWVASIAEPDGGIPFSLPASADYPRAPYLGPPAPGGSMFTMALAGWFHEAGFHTRGSSGPQRGHGRRWPSRPSSMPTASSARSTSSIAFPTSSARSRRSSVCGRALRPTVRFRSPAARRARS